MRGAVRAKRLTFDERIAAKEDVAILVRVAESGRFVEAYERFAWTSFLRFLVDEASALLGRPISWGWMEDSEAFSSVIVATQEFRSRRRP